MIRKELLGLFIILTVVAGCEALQAIRLTSGNECEMPGMFRDVFNCKKFYYCPGVSFSEVARGATEEKDVIKMLQEGFECPKGSIFEDTMRQCINLHEMKSIPPECQEPIENQSENRRLETRNSNYVRKGRFQ